MKKFNLKTAVIGVGNMGRNHVRTYASISNLVAVADLSPAVGQPVADLYRVPYYQDFLKMLTLEKPDAVSVAVPTKYHYQVAVKCLRLHLPILLEKPIAGTVNSARKIYKLAQSKKTFLMIGHVERFNPAVIKLKQTLDQGKLGKIINLLAVRVGVSLPKSPLSDVAIDLAIHDIDIFNYLLDKLPQQVKVVKQHLGRRNLADTASILIKYAGTVGLIQANWVTPIKIRKLYITGTKGFAELDYIKQQIITLEKPKLRPSPSFFELQELANTPVQNVFVSKKEPLEEELKYFLKHYQDAQPSPTVKSAIAALGVAVKEAYT